MKNFSRAAISLAMLTIVTPAFAENGPIIYRPFLGGVCEAAKKLSPLPTRYPEVDLLMSKLAPVCNFEWLPKEPETRCEKGTCTIYEQTFSFRDARSRRARHLDCPEGQRIENLVCFSSLPAGCRWECWAD